MTNAQVSVFHPSAMSITNDDNGVSDIGKGSLLFPTSAIVFISQHQLNFCCTDFHTEVVRHENILVEKIGKRKLS